MAQERINPIFSSDVSNAYAKVSSMSSSPSQTDPIVAKGIGAAGIGNLFAGNTSGFNAFSKTQPIDGRTNINITTLPGYNPFDESTMPKSTWSIVG